MNKAPDIFLADYLDEILPDAKCALVFSSPFQCLVAVMLSAQTSDEAVNKVTPNLFLKFGDAFSMSKASQKEIEDAIHSLGLYRNKAKNLLAMAKKLVEDNNGEVPNDFAKLKALPGVGVKTANVVSMECFGRPSIAVDTHVARISKRLGYAKEKDTPEQIEEKLERRFSKERQAKLHHQLIWFGRKICTAKSPKCEQCKLSYRCLYFKKSSSTTGK